jgi:hypothetical protein
MRPAPMTPILMRFDGAFWPNTVAGTMVGKAMPAAITPRRVRLLIVISLKLSTGLVAFFWAVSTSSAASRACAWSWAVEVRSTMSLTNCGPNGSATWLQSM